MYDFDDSKHALMNGLIRLMRAKEFRKITVDEICKESGVSRRNFYRYFEDKYELLEWLYYEDFWEPASKENLQNVVELLSYVCNFICQDREFYFKAFKDGNDNPFREFCKKRLQPYMERFYADVFSSEEAKHIWINHLLDATFDNFTVWMSKDEMETPNEFVRMISNDMINLSSRMIDLILPAINNDASEDEK